MTCGPGAAAGPGAAPPPDLLINTFDGMFLAEIDGPGTPLSVNPQTYFYPPARSPDGQRFVTAAYGDFAAHIYVFDAAGGDAIATLDGLPVAWLDDQTLLTEGRTTYPSTSPGPAQSLWRTPIDGSPPTLVYDAGARAIGSHTLSPDRSRVAFVEVDVTAGGLFRGAADVVSLPLADPPSATRSPSGVAERLTLPLRFGHDGMLVWAVGDTLVQATGDLSCVALHPTGEGVSESSGFVRWVGDDELLWVDGDGSARIVGTDGTVRGRVTAIEPLITIALASDRSEIVFGRGTYPGPYEWIVSAPDGSGARVQTWTVDPYPVAW